MWIENVIFVYKKFFYIESKLDVLFKNGLRFMVYVYDIIFVFVEVIVNLVNEDLVNMGGCV